MARSMTYLILLNLRVELFLPVEQIPMGRLAEWHDHTEPDEAFVADPTVVGESVEGVGFTYAMSVMAATWEWI